MILGAILVITFASLIPILVWPEGFTPHSSRYAPSNRRKPRLIFTYSDDWSERSERNEELLDYIL